MPVQRSGFYHEHTAKLKSVLAMPPGREIHELTVLTLASIESRYPMRVDKPLTAGITRAGENGFIWPQQG
jgi:hypothetical protein